MTSRPRKFDPDAIVHRSIARRFGVKTQAEIERDARFEKRLDTQADQLQDVPGPFTVKGDLLWEGGGEMAWPLGGGDQAFTILDRGFGLSSEWIKIKYEDSAGRVRFQIIDTFPVEFFEVNTLDPLSAGGFGCLTLRNSPVIRGFKDTDVTQTFSLDMATGNMVIAGTFAAGAGNLWLPYAHADPNAATISVVGMTAWTPSGTVASANGNSMPFIRYQTGAVSGNTAGLVGPAIFERQWGFDVRWKVNVETTATVRFWVALADANPNGADAPVSNICGFRYSTGAGDTTWGTRRGDGAAGGTGNSGVTVTAGNFDLRLVGDASHVEWWINGVKVDSRTTNIPTATVALAPYFQVTTLTNAAASERFNAMYAGGQ